MREAAQQQRTTSPADWFQARALQAAQCEIGLEDKVEMTSWDVCQGRQRDSSFESLDSEQAWMLQPACQSFSATVADTTAAQPPFMCSAVGIEQPTHSADNVATIFEIQQVEKVKYITCILDGGLRESGKALDGRRGVVSAMQLKRLVRCPKYIQLYGSCELAGVLRPYWTT